MKKIWVTALDHDEKKVQSILGTIRQYGLDGNGHFWEDDIKNMAWFTPKEAIVDKDSGLWVIVGSGKSLKTDTVRYGLAMLTLAVQAEKGIGFPVLFVDADGDVTHEILPTPLKGADIIAFDNASLGAKMVAKANTPVKEIDSGYRMAIHANPNYGVWFEVGPSGDSAWSGALLGVSNALIDAHGVGSAGKLPEKAILEYQMQGLKVQLGETEYTAWAVQNNLDSNNSYYVRVREMPESILFGPYSSEEEAEVHIINLY